MMVGLQLCAGGSEAGAVGSCIRSSGGLRRPASLLGSAVLPQILLHGDHGTDKVRPFFYPPNTTLAP